jgi:Ca2+-binding RTX toxin-like protein
LSFLALATTGTTILGSSSSNQVWADVFEGTKDPDVIFGTPGDDIIDSKGGNDANRGDTLFGDGSGDDVIVSGEGNDGNVADTLFGDWFQYFFSNVFCFHIC